jgi:hypothetical protein
VVLIIVVALIAGVILIGVVILVGGFEVLPLREIDDEVSGVATLKAAPR